MYYAIFLNKHGYNGQKEGAIKEGLIKGNKYLIEYASIGQSNSTIHLKGFRYGFNSVMFDFVDENGEETSIFENAEWNPYLQVNEM